jgi:signal peptidase I
VTVPSVRRPDDDTQPIPVVRGRHAAPRPKRSPGQWAVVIAREAGIVAAIVVALVIVARLVIGQVAYVADDAMEPTLSAGERVVVTAWGQPGPGDIVLVRSPEGWAATAETAVSRIIAVGGQRVACCDDAGRITVDGTPLDEPYVAGATDQLEFDVVVPDGRVFVLADNRATARDSRALLDTEGGTLPVDDVLGRVTLVAWPPRGLVN